MPSTPTTIDTRHHSSESPNAANTVALTGFILAILSALLCALLFFLAGQLPTDTTLFQEQLSDDTPAQLRLLILGCSAALLNVTSLVLCVIGLILPNRPRVLASIGTGFSLMLLLGVFGVIALGALMKPEPRTENSPDSNEANVLPDSDAK